MGTIDVLVGKWENTLADQDRLHGAVREEVQQVNLVYALQEIRPTSHTELALAVWAGSRLRQANVVIDEYC